MAELEEAVGYKPENPYVGPRTFAKEEVHKFFGRDREARDLIALIVSERLVLFYAQSGAGKSSLINTKVISGLEAEGFEVLPIGSVSGQSGLEVDAENIFVYNLILSLQQGAEPIANAQHLTLLDFLDSLVFRQGIFRYEPDYVYAPDDEIKPRVLLIDQFEEILTTNTPFWEQRTGFFEHLAAAMAADEQLWVVLTMREDFVGSLDAYLHHLQDAPYSRFYMQRLARTAALEAITCPVANLRPFEKDAAQTLVDNLSQIKLDDGRVHRGEFIEPVQLQAVCYQMWEKLEGQPGETITKTNVEHYADVDTALINFYDETIASTVRDTGVSEIDLRLWFEKDLITEAGTRDRVYRGEETTGSLPTRVADYVNKKFIIREINQPGGIWYELIHDRFVAPIVQSNHGWRLEQPLIQLCEEWFDSDCNDAHLLSSWQLGYYSEQNWQALGSRVARFIEASQIAKEQREKRRAEAQAAAAQRELRQQQALAAEQEARADEAVQAALRQERLTRIAIVVGVLAVIASFIAIYFFADAQASEARAVARLETAVTAQAESMNVRASQEALLAELLEKQLTATPVPTESGGFVVQYASSTPTPEGTATPSAEQDLAIQLAQVRATQTVVAAGERTRDSVLVGASVQGLPIEAARIGDGPDRILLVGGIHSGKSPSTVAVAEEMIAYFRDNPGELPDNISLFIVPNLNPDSPQRTGRIEGRFNANGVDLNRNWNCLWNQNPVVVDTVIPGAGGETFLSEPETRALAEFILEHRPVAVVAWYALSLPPKVNPGGCTEVLVSEELAEEYAAAAPGYEVGDHNTGVIYEGDFTNWLDSIGIPGIAVLLRSHEKPDLKNNLTAVQRVIELHSRR